MLSAVETAYFQKAAANGSFDDWDCFEAEDWEDSDGVLRTSEETSVFYFRVSDRDIHSVPTLKDLEGKVVTVRRDWREDAGLVDVPLLQHWYNFVPEGVV